MFCLGSGDQRLLVDWGKDPAKKEDSTERVQIKRMPEDDLVLRELQ